MSLKNILFLCWLAPICFSCHSYSGKLADALHYSQENRPELEKVLKHYLNIDKNEEKLRAAVFLIENMPGHFSVTPSPIGNFKQDIDSMYAHRPAYLRQFLKSRYPKYDCDISDDARTITAAYLIHHIDFMFGIWKTTPWLKEISFDIFKETLLPYQMNYLRMEDADYKAMRELNEEFKAYAGLYEFLRHDIVHQQTNSDFLGVEKARSLLYNPIPLPDGLFQADCSDHAAFNMYAMKYAGIPLYNDFVPYLNDAAGGHEWVLLADPCYRRIGISYFEKTIFPRIFRNTYAHNDIPLPSGEGYIPPLFCSPFLKDVTAEYVPVKDVTPELRYRPATSETNYLYLAVFNNMQLHPIAWAVNKRKTNFKEMSYGVVYFPVFYTDSLQKSAGSPFTLQRNDRIHYFTPHENQKQNITISRKFPLNYGKVMWSHILAGSRIEVSNTEDFARYTTVHTVPVNPDLNTISVPLDTPIECRYLRFKTDKEYEIAELKIKDRCGEPLEAKIVTGEAGVDYNLLFDNDILTFIHLRNELILDLGKPVGISEIIYTPHTDDNGIVPGEKYELFYYHPESGWLSCGEKIASGNKLTYSVPTGCLYWLRNKTKGIEERIFSIEDGKQRFW